MFVMIFYHRTFHLQSTFDISNIDISKFLFISKNGVGTHFLLLYLFQPTLPQNTGMPKYFFRNRKIHFGISIFYPYFGLNADSEILIVAFTLFSLKEYPRTLVR